MSGSPKKGFHAQWQWKHNLESHDDDAWVDYSFADEAKLEHAYQKKEKTIKLNKDYSVDFEKMIQFLTSDSYRQRPIRRRAKEIEWHWQHDTEKMLWTKYDTNDTATLEKAYQKNKNNSKVKLNDTYCADFVNMVQFRAEDWNRQRPIKRIGLKESLVDSSKKHKLDTSDSGSDSNKKAKTDLSKEAKDILAFRKVLRKTEEADEGTESAAEKKQIALLIKKTKAFAKNYPEIVNADEVIEDDVVDYDMLYQATEERFVELGYDLEDCEEDN